MSPSEDTQPAAPQRPPAGTSPTDSACGEPAVLVPLIYDELRRLAHQVLVSGRRPGDTLSTTVLVHEAFLRLFKGRPVPFDGRAHLFGTAARAMRSIVVDHARRRTAAKRGGGRRALAIGGALELCQRDEPDVLAVDEALTCLAAVDPRKAQIVELRFFGGLTVEEAAEAVGVAPATIKREWTLAKGWLRHALENK